MPILRSQITNNISIQRFARRVANLSAALITDRERQIRRAIDSQLPLIIENNFDVDNRMRIRNLARRISEQLQASLDRVETLIQREIENMVESQIEFEKESYERFTNTRLRGSPITAVMRDLRSTPFLAGLTLSTSLDSIAASRRTQTERTLGNAVYSSATFRDTRRSLVGTAVPTSGVTGFARTNVQTIARTSVNFAVNRVKIRLAETTGISRYRYVAVLDDRTSDICAANDGEIFSVGDPDAPIPPLHPNCRSIIVYELPETSAGTRPSETGIEEADLSYEDWLREQPVSFVNNVLGPTKAALFLEGGFTLQDFVRSDFSSISVAELERTNEATFDRLDLT